MKLGIQGKARVIKPPKTPVHVHVVIVCLVTYSLVIVITVTYRLINNLVIHVLKVIMPYCIVVTYIQYYTCS